LEITQNSFITDPRALASKTGQTPYTVNKLPLYHTMSPRLCRPECLRKKMVKRKKMQKRGNSTRIERDEKKEGRCEGDGERGDAEEG
jgi:hypothetical protein